jgi:hypothetical protein
MVFHGRDLRAKCVEYLTDYHGSKNKKARCLRYLILYQVTSISASTYNYYSIVDFEREKERVVNVTWPSR